MSEHTAVPAPIAAPVAPPVASEWQLVRQQARVVEALMVREIFTRFGRENIGFLWIIAEPAMFACGVIALWSAYKHGGHAETPIVPFLLTGYMPLLLFRHMCAFLSRCMQANASLLYHRQITVMSLYVARITIEFIGTTGSFAFCMLVFGLFGFVEVPDDLGLMLLGWLLYFWFAAALAMCVGALSERSELVEKFWNPISYIMIPLSGTFYMVHWMPDAVREYLLYVPQVNGVEMIRGGYFGPGVPTFFDPVYLIYCNLVLSVMSLYFLKDARDHVEVE